MNEPLQAVRPGEPIGLLAGWGELPLRVAVALRRQGARVFCLGIKDHVQPELLAEHCEDYREVGVAKFGAAIRYFNRHGVRRATMAGKIHKVAMFRRFALLRHLPDWTCLKAFYPFIITRSRDRQDDTLLLAVVKVYADHGIDFVPATDFAPELLVNLGTLTRQRPNPVNIRDIQFGWRLAKEIGRLDVGQTVAVKNQAVLAVEAIEGTDECIRRAGELCKQGGFTVVKVAKPQQDMRFDVPTIGMQTLQTLQQAGGKVLAVEAHRTIVLDDDATVEFANRHGIIITAIENGAESEAA
ncbi:MAG: UDP-2,3-diacylglucosamine diphosphatase LpxI [Pirellulaceae bacterium]|jgi:hypothetical protein|nr:UDP-2,3-diacylglucosamine diphosphatase LpxI [Pirellulaceae bacterium]MDP7018662.1 UDP-2,3-diacylglucosamine diphosphatase LpxI [Pirellulaceae bacterium]